MSPADTGTKGAAGGALATCPRCAAGVELPANYCDMCGNAIRQRAAADLRPRPEPPADRRERHPAQASGTVSEQRHGATRGDPEAARRSLASAYGTIKNIEKTIDSIEVPAGDENVARRFLRWIASGRRVRREAADLRRTLGLARKEARRAADLDSDAAIETDDGRLSVQALLALVDRVEGTIELFAGKTRAAILHYQSSINILETRDAYLDLAFAYERIGQPGQALSLYERCTARVPDGQVDAFAEDEADRLRAKMIMGGWFVGSWITAGALAYIAALSLLSLLVFPLAGKVALVGSGGVLIIYVMVNFRRPVRSDSRERQPSDTS